MRPMTVSFEKNYMRIRLKWNDVILIASTLVILASTIKLVKPKEYELENSNFVNFECTLNAHDISCLYTFFEET